MAGSPTGGWQDAAVSPTGAHPPANRGGLVADDQGKLWFWNGTAWAAVPGAASAALSSYVADVTAASATNPTTVTHNLGSTDVLVQFTSNETGTNHGKHVIVDWQITDANTVKFWSTIANAKYRVRILKVA